MRFHRFINSLLLCGNPARGKRKQGKEENARLRRFFVVFLDKSYISQVIHFKFAVIFVIVKNFCIGIYLYLLEPIS